MDSRKNIGVNTITKEGEMQNSIVNLLEFIGENPLRKGLLKTPERVTKAWQSVTEGYQKNPYEILQSALFEEEYNQMVLVKDIEVFSICEHHLLPFFGMAHIAYIPNGKVVGLSKIPRIINVFARRLQLQERLTTEIGECLHEGLQAKGVAVALECKHMCMMIRGVEKVMPKTKTFYYSGVFREDSWKNEWYRSLALTNKEL